MFTLTEGSDGIGRESIVELYESVGWTAYTRAPDALILAVANTSFVVAAWSRTRLVGLLRALSDGVSICYIQDIVVHPELHRRGVGRAMVQRCLDHHADVRQKVLITDGRPEQRAFYASLGFSDTGDLVDVPLRAFVQFKGVKLS